MMHGSRRTNRPTGADAAKQRPGRGCAVGGAVPWRGCAVGGAVPGWGCAVGGAVPGRGRVPVQQDGFATRRSPTSATPRLGETNRLNHFSQSRRALATGRAQLLDVLDVDFAADVADDAGADAAPPLPELAAGVLADSVFFSLLADSVAFEPEPAPDPDPPDDLEAPASARESLR